MTYSSIASRSVRLFLVALTVVMVSALVAGCGYTEEEQAYLDQIDSIRSQYNELADESEVIGDSMDSDLAAAESGSLTMAEVTRIVDTYMPQIQQLASGVSALRDEMYQIKPQASFVDAHPLYLQGMDKANEGMGKLLQAMELLRNATLAKAENAVSLSEEAIDDIEEAETLLNDGDAKADEVGISTSWASTIGGIVGFLAVTGIIVGIIVFFIRRRKPKAIPQYSGYASSSGYPGAPGGQWAPTAPRQVPPPGQQTLGTPPPPGVQPYGGQGGFPIRTGPTEAGPPGQSPYQPSQGAPRLPGRTAPQQGASGAPTVGPGAPTVGPGAPPGGPSPPAASDPAQPPSPPGGAVRRATSNSGPTSEGMPRVCPGCRKTVPPGSDVCIFCGKDLDSKPDKWV